MNIKFRCIQKIFRISKRFFIINLFVCFLYIVDEYYFILYQIWEDFTRSISDTFRDSFFNQIGNNINLKVTKYSQYWLLYAPIVITPVLFAFTMIIKYFSNIKKLYF